MRASATGFLAARLDLAATNELIGLLLEAPTEQSLIRALAKPAPDRCPGDFGGPWSTRMILSAGALVASLARMQSEESLASIRAALGSANDAARRAAASALLALQGQAERFRHRACGALRPRRRSAADLHRIANPMSPGLPLSPQVFAILSALIEERTGLHYDVQELELLAERVSGRAIERGFESLLDYYYFLRYDAAADAELPLLAEALVVHETYFFRELAPLKVVVSDLVPRLLARGSQATHLVCRLFDRRGAAHPGHAAGRGRALGPGHTRGQRYQRARIESGTRGHLQATLAALATAWRDRSLASKATTRACAWHRISPAPSAGVSSTWWMKTSHRSSSRST